MTDYQQQTLEKAAAFGNTYPELSGFLADYAYRNVEGGNAELVKQAGLGDVLKWGLILGGLGLGGKYLYDNNETARNFMDSLTKKETYQNLWDKAKGLFGGSSESPRQDPTPTATADSVANEIGAQAQAAATPVFQEQ